MPKFPRRILSHDELLENVRRARQLAERYEVGVANPENFMDQSPDEQARWDDLLRQMN